MQVIFIAVCWPKFMKCWENIRTYCNLHAVFRSPVSILPKIFAISKVVEKPFRIASFWVSVSREAVWDPKFCTYILQIWLASQYVANFG